MANQQFQITEGLSDYQIIQRNRQNRAHLSFTVQAQQDGKVTAKITRGSQTLKGFGRCAAGTISNGAGNLQIKGLPTGGPYTIDLMMGKQRVARISQICVGDLWIMGGQSNMQGVGVMRDALKPQRCVHMFSMRDEWAKAKDPINHAPTALDKAYHGLDHYRNDEETRQLQQQAVKGVGPGLSFASWLAKTYRIPIGLIPCAKGGSSMQQWDPALKSLGGDSLYGACLRRARAAGGTVNGMIWSQGCSDANYDDAQLYTKRMKTLIASLSRDLDQPLPWIMTQINGFYDTNRWNLDPLAWTSIRHQQFELEALIPNVRCVSTVDLDLDDGIHLSALAQHRTGKRMARAAATLCGYDKHDCQSPYIKSISSRRGNAMAATECGSYAIQIAGHCGKLHAPGRVLGFGLFDDSGNECKTIYKSWIKDDYIILQTELKTAELQRYRLYYGFGTTPVCNIVDDHDMALTASGPYDLSGV